MRAVAVLAGLFVITACEGPPQDMPEGPFATDEVEVENTLAERMADWEDALAAGDVPQVMSFWTADAHVWEPGVDVSGTDLVALFEGFFESGRVVDPEFRRLDIFVHGDVAYEISEYDEPIQAGEGELNVRRYYCFIRWKRGLDGIWRFDRVVMGPR